MDTELLRTFLEVRKTRHFAKAADNLFITQAAVSARIKQLEGLMGQRLLTRDRNNIQLTAAGHQLVPNAESMLEIWSRALLETATGELPLLVMGCLSSLRETYLDGWLAPLLIGHPDWRLQLESLNTLEVISRVRDRSLDLGLIYEAPRAPDLWSEELASFELRLVSAFPGMSLESGLENYIHVDWGTSLAAARDTQLSGRVRVRARLDSAVLARRLILALGGCAFLPHPLVAADIAEDRLFPVADSPTPTRVAFLVGASERRDTPAVDEMVAAIHACIAARR
jgi:DNA-binding transcriptional LysR family regulator